MSFSANQSTEFCVAPYEAVMKVPKGVNMIDAAGIRMYNNWNINCF